MRSPASCRLSDRSNFALCCSQPSSLAAPAPAARARPRGVFCHAQHHLEQRAVRQAARRLAPLRPPARTAAPGAAAPPARCAFTCCQQLRDAGRLAEVDAQRQRVDEEADQPLDLGRCRLATGVPMTTSLLARQPRQQRGPGGQQRHEQRHAVAPAQRLQRARQRRIELDLAAAPRRSPAAPAAAGRSAAPAAPARRAGAASSTAAALQHLASQPAPLPGA